MSLPKEAELVTVRCITPCSETCEFSTLSTVNGTFHFHIHRWLAATFWGVGPPSHTYTYTHVFISVLDMIAMIGTSNWPRLAKACKTSLSLSHSVPRISHKISKRCVQSMLTPPGFKAWRCKFTNGACVHHAGTAIMSWHKEGIPGNRPHYRLISQLSVTVQQVAVVATGFY